MNKYRQALKNYTTTVAPEKILKDIENIILDFGGTGIIWDYDSERKISGLMFKIEVDGATRLVNVPLLVGKTKGVLEKQKVIPKRDTWSRYYEQQTAKDWDLAYRVTLANIRDWLDAQLAIYATEMFEIPQIFLPYLADQNGVSLYDKLKSNNYQIGYNND